MKLGILGGTFDPVHRGHLSLAGTARDELGLENVLFVPAAQPWRKAGRRIASEEHRLAMLRLALEGETEFKISALEIERGGPSYTADTLEALTRVHPHDELFFIMGEDALVDLPNWVRPLRILELATLAVARRADLEPRAVEEAARRLPGLLQRVVWLEMPLLPVSATEIREKVARGESIAKLVTEAVEAYIREHRLYAD